MKIHHQAVTKLLRAGGFVAAVVAVIPATSPAANAQTVDAARARGLGWVLQQQAGDGALRQSGGLEIQATASLVEAMHSAGLTASPQYLQALSYLSNAQASSTDAQSARIVALVRAARNATTASERLSKERSNFVIAADQTLQFGGSYWGTYRGYGASVLDTSLALRALRESGFRYSGDYDERSGAIACGLLQAQLVTAPWNGAWPHQISLTPSAGIQRVGSILSTAAAVYELRMSRLSQAYVVGSSCGTNIDSGIDSALSNAKAWLLAQANTDGGFAERNPASGALEPSSVLATAWVIPALNLFASQGDALANAAMQSARNWLVDRQNADGSWLGDPFVTTKVLTAFPNASGTQLTDTDRDGLTDVVEQRLGSQVNTADAQSLLRNNAASQPGVTSSAFSANGVVGQMFTMPLNTSGVSGATYALRAGQLPPGITLSPAGLLQGIPTQEGSFAFDYERSVGGSTKELVIGRVEVMAARSQVDGDVPIPPWAIAGLGLVLVAALRRKRDTSHTGEGR